MAELEKLRRERIRSANPARLVTAKSLPGVTVSVDARLCRRETSESTLCNWYFTIQTQGKALKQVYLALEETHDQFALVSVSKDGIDYGMTNGQEWQETVTDLSAIHMDKTENTVRYTVQVCFYSKKYGTYRQNVVFDFGEYPVVLRRICVDCLPKEDLPRIQTATEYQLSQYPTKWTDETARIHKFESPLVPLRDHKGDELSVIYPYPNKENFLLTQDSLTDDCLTASNYRGRLHELITIEELARHELIARYNNISYMRLLSRYILISAGDAATVTKYAPSGELFAQLPLNRNISEDTRSGRLLLRGCNTVLFRRFASSLEPPVVYEAHIEDVCTQSVYVRLSKKCVDEMKLAADTDLEVQVQFSLNRIPFCEWHRAVDSLPDVGLVCPNINRLTANTDILNLLDVDAFAFSKTWDWLIQSSLLNVQQKRAVVIMTSLAKIPLPPILLLGPFGTGKTFTIAQALHTLLTQNPENKILLCTHSNSAADLYVKEFFDVWYKSDRNPLLKPIRIYFKGRARNTVHPTVQEYCLIGENGSFREPAGNELANCGLIVTTLATSSCLLDLNLSLSHIVIDEAAQALECEILMPLALMNPGTRLILAGDQMQLAPEICSDLASERGLGISLLERIYKLYPENHPCCIHLCQNYRAHEDIIAFTSEMFYGGIIKPGKNFLVGHPDLKPLTFYAVAGEEVQDVHSTGYVHATEAYEIANRVLELRSTWPVDRWGPCEEGSIGVLAYYAEQVQRIRAELRKRKLFDVSVERVLNAQGKQFTAVFISTVRTRNCCRYSAERRIKDYGFLTNPRLLNTAITRAKCLVAVVGDPVALMTVGSCRHLWQKYLELADLRGIDRDTLKYHLSLVPKLPQVTPLNPLAEEFVPRNPQNCYIEYVPVPMMYPVVHCNINHDSPRL